ncbi:MAG: tryptophan synthase subunit alpha [Bacteroidota bacterium]
MNRINKLFQEKESHILSVFFTAGYPNLDDTVPTIEALAAAGVDLIEIGMPFSDPIADGSTIQMSNGIALENGFTLDLLFEQLADIRQRVDIPLILMGYLNPVVQYGIERFLAKAAEIGIDGTILPDLPMYEYQNFYKAQYERHDLRNIFLITPQTSDARIREIDAVGEGFIYVVSTDATTGKTSGFGPNQVAYFERIADMQLKNPTLIGFGIHDNETFSQAAQHAKGAIIGSAFIKALGKNGSIEERVGAFVRLIRGEGESVLQDGP